MSAPVDGASSPPKADAANLSRSTAAQTATSTGAKSARPGNDPVDPSGRRRGASGAPHRRKPKRRRRTWIQRLIIAVNLLLVMVCLLSAGALAWFKQQVAEVKRVDMGGTLSEQASSMEPANFLLVGVDNSFGLDPKDPIMRGRGGELNTDTIMLLRIDPGSHKAWILSFPRDLLVTIPRAGGKNRINTALSTGGPGLLVETIQQNFQIKINHYVQVNLHGFEQLVDAIGGVPVYFNKQGRDTHSNLAPTGPGCVTLNGAHALAFARSRYYETLSRPGVWESDPSSDLGRIRRQQEFMRSALKKAIDRGARNPFTLKELINTAQQNVVLDASLTTQMLIDLGTEFRDFDPDTLEVLTPPVTRQFYGAMDALALDGQKAQPMFDIFRGANPTLNLLKTVRVEVRNGNGTLGYGKQVADSLGRVGFSTKSEDNPLYKSDKTVIKYSSGVDPVQTKAAQFNALVLARYIEGDVVIEEDPSVTGDTPVVLVVGRDFKPPRDVANPRPLSDFDQYLPPELKQAASQPAQVSTTLPATLPPSTFPSEVPSIPPGTDCR